ASLTLAAGETRDIYLYVRTSSLFNVPIQINSEKNFAELHLNGEWVNGIFYGIGIGLVCYNLFLFIYVREKSYLFYIFHVLFALMFYFCVQGFGQIVWPEQLEWNDQAEFFFAHLCLANAYWFAMAFLAIDRKSALGGLLSIAAVLSVGFALGKFVWSPHVNVLTVSLNGVVAAILLIGAGLLKIRDNFKPARYFVSAWSVFLLAVAMVALNSFGVINSIMLSLYGLQAGIILQQSLLSLALGKKINSLKQAKLDADAASLLAQAEHKAKNDFLARMSHEIRTPLNGVIGLAQVLQDSPLDEDQQHYAKTIFNSGKALINIINDILDIERIESGLIDLEKTDFDLASLLKECATMFKPMAVEKRIQFNVSVDPRIPKWLKGDPGRVRQVLLNLLSNAVKFTRNGYVNLSAKAIDAELNKPVRVLIEVVDSGIGIPEEMQYKLFQAYSQTDVATARKFGGTGLGLIISKQLVELMNGEINFSSEEGKGSRFWLTLAFEKGVAPKDLDVTSNVKLFNNAQVLVAEDNPVNQKVISALMKKLGAHTTIVNNGIEVVEAIRMPKSHYDLVFMDCEMPELDGYQATRIIREIEQTEQRSRTPIIALTAHALREHQRECFAAGMDDHLAKPIDLKTLTIVMEKWVA
ncbi:MAG TPA: 7TM diverse intracellular signaling domain-containing protein, partial [Pseudomonadales bacterium]|nr:7TM diverse intracellular signaling domain-containing protein [Pseudomonadales bacterium]